MQTTVQNLKRSLIKFVDYMVKDNTTQNHIYEQLADQVWREEIAPFVKNENVTGFQADIKKRFIDNPYCRYAISEKQAYCLAAAFQSINNDTILAK